MKRYITNVFLAALMLLALVAGASGAQVEARQEQLIHTVRAGETLFSIARLYGVTVNAIAQANNLANVNLIFIGQRLIIPRPMDQTVIHVVAPGETLSIIAARYGVSILAIVTRNNIANPNVIFVGQRLVIPLGTQPPPTQPPSVQEAIIITSPARNAQVSSPVTITGWGSGFEQSLAVAVQDIDGNVIGQGFVSITAQPGQIGPFTGTVTFTPPATNQVGRIQVYSVSARDGGIEHLTSVDVNLRR